MFTLEPELLVAFLVDLGFFFGAAILLLIWLIFSRKDNKKLRAENAGFLKSLTEVKEQVGKIVESQRLSTILKLEPSSLKVKPEDFEPNKEIVRAKLLEQYEKEKHPCLETRAYVILYYSGWAAFVDSQTYTDARLALMRLLTNEDKEAIIGFLNEIVDKL